MLGRAKVYTGPDIALWRRFALSHSRKIFGLLIIAAIILLMGSVVLRWQLPAGLPSVVFSLLAFTAVVSLWVHYERQRLVRETPLPQFLKHKLRETYPHLSGKDAELVERGLRQYFLACLRSKGKFVAMPSRVVDSMWHEFILHTRAYRDWCDLILGRFIDHVPAEVLGNHAKTNDDLRRAWYWACRDETISPKAPTRLPLLFALDGKLNTPNGFAYAPDCSKPQRDEAGSSGGAYCGESFSDGSYSGDADSFGGSDTSSSGGAGGDAGGGDGGGGGCGGGD